nr:carbohydrate ABC transporter permease [Desulfuromonadales bacterium]
MSANASTYSVVAPTPWARRLSALLVIAYALITMVPLVWIFST